MADYQLLKSYLNANSGMTDAAILTALNTANIAVPQYVPTSAIADYLGTNGTLFNLIEWAASPPTGASNVSIVAAKELAFAFTNPTLIAGFDMTNATVAASMEASLNALVNPGSGIVAPITATDQANILALSVINVSLATSTYGFNGPITEDDLNAARNLP